MDSKLLVCSVFAVFLITGCTAHKLSIQEDGSGSVIYQIDERKLFDLVYTSMKEVFPQEEISIMSAPTRGYKTVFLAPPFFIDKFTQRVFVHRSSGVNTEGIKIYGYWIEVTGQGTSFLQGQLRNKEVYNSIISQLDKKAIKQKITNVSKAAYLVPNAKFNIRWDDTPEVKGSRIIISKDRPDEGELNNQAKKLRDLHRLKLEGVLTDDEYNKAKKKILDRY